MTAIFKSSPPRKRSRSPTPINNHCPPCTESGYFFRKRNRSAIEYAFGVASFAHNSQLLTRCRNALPESPPKRFCDIPVHRESWGEPSHWESWRFIPKGWQKVAGGRSIAKTTGMVRNDNRILEGCQKRWNDFRRGSRRSGIPTGCNCIVPNLPGVSAALRPPATV